MDEINDVFTVPADPMRIRQFWHLTEVLEGGLVKLTSYDNLNPKHQPMSRTTKREYCLNVSKPLGGKSAGTSGAVRKDVLGR